MITMVDKLEQARQLIPQPVAGGYEVRGVKSLETHNGVAWTGKLFKDGKHIADVEDRGDGGQMWLHAPTANYPGWGMRQGELIAELEVAAAKHGTAEYFGDERIEPNWEMFLADLSGRHEELARLRRLARSKILYFTGGQRYSCNVAPTPQNIAAVEAKYAGCVVLNGALRP